MRAVKLLSRIRASAYARPNRADIALGKNIVEDDLRRNVRGFAARRVRSSSDNRPGATRQSPARVDYKLDTQAAFTLMESTVAQQIACGHAFALDAPNRGKVDQDFVYLHGQLIMDDDPDFDQAAMECDVASSGGNSMVAENTADQ